MLHLPLLLVAALGVAAHAAQPDLAPPAAPPTPAAATPADPVAPPEAPRPTPAQAVDGARLMATLRELPTARAALGDEASRAGLVATEELLLTKLRALGYEPREQAIRWALPARGWGRDDADAPAAEGAEPPPPPTQWRNIWVDLPGTDLAHEVLLLGAHFDAVPGSPGADDNGTGTAAALELARVLYGIKSRRTIRIAFFNLEEVGLIGATRYVASLTPPPVEEGDAEAPPQERIVGMVSMEMLGYFSDEPGSQKSPIPAIEGVFTPPTVGDTICIVGIAKHRAFSGSLDTAMRASAPALKTTLVDFLPVPVPDMLRSDHRPFLMAGIPAVMLTDTSNFRNPHYHLPSDTIDTLDPERFTLVVRALAGAAVTLADAPVSTAVTPAP